MAGVNLEPQTARAAPRPIEQRMQDLATFIFFGCTLAVACDPGILLGAVPAAAWWYFQRPPQLEPPSTWLRWTCAALFAVPLVAVHSLVLWGWPLQAFLDGRFSPASSDSGMTPSMFNIGAEALLGPLWFECVLFAARLRERRIGAEVVRDHKREQVQWGAITGRKLPPIPPAPPDVQGRAPSHPAGRIRLGVDMETKRPFDLVPGELAQHVFIPGASGSGKTTTLARLADGALANSYGLVFVDCKVGGLARVARSLAARHKLPFRLVDPDVDGSLGYNPCSGDAAGVANKLVGAFTYGGDAEIYKNIAMEIVPVIVRALKAADRPVTLEAVYQALGKGGLGNLAQQLSDAALRDRLRDLEQMGGIGAAGYNGLQRRLGALLEGKFGELFRAENALDWDQALTSPSVTYIALSAQAASEDVELMGRVIAQDLKQACARRLRWLDEGKVLPPVLAVFDEFAALREAEQIIDLLLQARQALVPTVVSVQYLPINVPLRKALLGAGLVLAHRVEAEDSEALAAQFGTRRSTAVTHQLDYETGYSEKGSIRAVDKYILSPQEFRNLDQGRLAARSVPGKRHAIVQVIPPE